MPDREIDMNMTANKSPRPHTVIIKCSDRRFKLFLYAARKKLRSDHPNLAENLYMNDDLTSFNYGLMKRVKNMSKLRVQNLKMTFETVYSFNGRVFVKLKRSDSSDSAILIKNSSSIDALVAKLDSSE